MHKFTRVAVLAVTLLPVMALAQNLRSQPPARSSPAPAAAPSCNTAGRTIALVLDASGSLNAKLPNGETRIDVAR